ncbi:MAG TPA: zinc-ribbon domain-containing protein, partial [Synergistales bacterium]|nr:zinc-ribbon domain-containing protein [Synergistales bacterium]
MNREPSLTLAEAYPGIAAQWHPRNNGSLLPSDVHPGSHKKVWWKCPEGEDHEWEVGIVVRTTMGTGCPICAGRKVVTSTCLETTHPEIARQWHPTLNGSQKPSQVHAGSPMKVWWKCDKGDDHVWKT